PLRPTADRERVRHGAGTVGPADRKPSRAAARPPAVPARCSRAPARVHPADVIRACEVVEAPIRAEALAVHGDAVRSVEPINPVSGAETPDRDEPPREPALADRVVLGDDDAAYPARPSDSVFGHRGPLRAPVSDRRSRTRSLCEAGAEDQRSDRGG